jgi:hypothetical protein
MLQSLQAQILEVSRHYTDDEREMTYNERMAHREWVGLMERNDVDFVDERVYCMLTDICG